VYPKYKKNVSNHLHLPHTLYILIRRTDLCCQPEKPCGPSAERTITRRGCDIRPQNTWTAGSMRHMDRIAVLIALNTHGPASVTRLVLLQLYIIYSMNIHDYMCGPSRGQLAAWVRSNENSVNCVVVVVVVQCT